MGEHAHNEHAQAKERQADGRRDLDARAAGEPESAPVELERLMEEINILRLEGALFCFDPREARRRSGSLTVELSHGELGRHPVTIKVDADFGQPSVLAYKVLQAVFLKLAQNGCELTEDGRCLYPNKVPFTFRELARITDRTWSGRTAKQIAHAIMQLHTTRVQCSFYDKETEEWAAATFYIIPRALFSGKGSEINACVIELDTNIVKSINKRHFAFFNLYRLNTLDTIGVVLYKRIFFHFSNINQRKTQKHALRFEKDYEDICREWLGGLKPERYASRIRKQLGGHLEALTRTQLIRRYDIREKAKGNGFKLVFYPGEAFFDDYREYYLRAQQPQVALPQVAGVRNIQQPLELVAAFHRALGHSHQRFEEKETAYASELLATYSEAELRDLIEYAVEDARKTGFAERMRWFGVLRNYLPRWQADRGRRAARKRQATAVANCPYCDESGHLVLRDRGGHFGAFPCPHDIERISALEDERGLRRV